MSGIIAGANISFLGTELPFALNLGCGDPDTIFDAFETAFDHEKDALVVLKLKDPDEPTPNIGPLRPKDPLVTDLAEEPELPQPNPNAPAPEEAGPGKQKGLPAVDTLPNPNKRVPPV